MFLVVLVTGLGVGIVASQTSLESRSSARDTQPLPAITPPYLRLANPRSGKSSEEVLVDILINTAGSETLATDVVIQYDPSTLSLAQDNVISKEQYRVMVATSLTDGIMSISMFSNPERGEPTVSTSIDSEAVLATLMFTKTQASVKSTQVNILYQPGSLKQSNIIPVYDIRPETPQTILLATQGIEIIF